MKFSHLEPEFFEFASVHEKLEEGGNFANEEDAMTALSSIADAGVRQDPDLCSLATAKSRARVQTAARPEGMNERGHWIIEARWEFGGENLAPFFAVAELSGTLDAAKQYACEHFDRHAASDNREIEWAEVIYGQTEYITYRISGVQSEHTN
jgi:hypothetical protein